MPTTTEETWLDVIPAIPLEKGVCVLEGHLRKCIVVGDSDLPGCVVVYRCGGGLQEWNWKHDLRVDLSTENGFGYALRLEWKLPGRIMANGAADDRLLWRHVEGKTTDTDRLAVARALSPA